MNKVAMMLVAVVLLTGCNKGTKNLFSRKTGVEINQVDFDYFSSKIKIDFDGVKNVSGTANVRMKKDSVIWMSLSPGFGVEIARVLITTDSVSIIDKFNKQYISRSFDQVSEQVGFDVDFHLVESIMLGNLLFPYSKEKVKKEEKLLVYEQLLGRYLVTNQIGKESMKLEGLNVVDETSKSAIYVSYAKFQKVGDQILPYQIEAKLDQEDASKNTKVAIDYSKAEIETESLKFPFNVPEKYKRR